MASKQSESPGELVVRVRATPHARKEKVEEIDGVLCIAVRERAEENRANVRIKEIVAERFAVPITQVRMVTGMRSRSKLIRISRTS